MKFKTFKSTGIVIAKKNYKEADRIITLYSKDFGKLTLIAKGVRKMISKKRGSLETGTIINFQATTTNSFHILTEVETLSDSFDIVSNLKKSSVMYFISETIAKLIHDEEKNEKLYELIKDTIMQIKMGANLKNLRREYSTKLVILLGFWPENSLLENPDKYLEGLIEKKLNSIRIGKKMVS